MNITELLFSNQDLKYKSFQSNLIPNISFDSIIGVRVPIIKNIAKDLFKNNEYSSFLEDLPHKYYDEYMLHSAILSLIKDYDECVSYLDKYLHFVDNWAVCDTIKPKCFIKNKDLLINDIKRWVMKSDTYSVRFGISMLMTYFLDEDFKSEYLDIVCDIKSDEYYINMMRAWFFATSLAKNWDSTIKYIENRKLDKWTHNKTIRKSIESFRISLSEKDYLRELIY